MVYAGAKPYYDEYKAAKDFTQKAKATPSMLPSVPTKESPSPSAIPTIESPSPTPEVLQHPIDAQWIVLNHGGEMLQVPVVDRPAEIVKNWHIEGSPETTNLPAPTGNIVGPDGVEYNDKQYVVRWQEGPKIGSQGPAIITGHNVSDGLGGPSGAGVFDYLPQAKEGATMAVIGLDSNNQMTKLTYRAVKIVPFSKGDLNGVPNALAQMPKGVTFTAVTCAGDFTNNQATGETSHDGNAAVGYELVAVEPM